MLDYRTHTFLEVYRQRSFTRAAAALLITQPAVSQHIRQLEAYYGCALFTKTSRGVEPTPAGDMLYQRLLTMENDEERLRAAATALAAGAEEKAADAPLHFGCTRTIADYLAPRLVARHVLEHPRSEVKLVAGNTRGLIEALEHGDIDFALVEGSFDRKRFAFAMLSTEPYCAVAAPWRADGEDPRPSNPRARRAPSSVRDLLGERLILREAGSGTREILEKHLAARDLAPSDFAGTVELESIPSIKACVQAGAGITFMYRVAVEDELARGDLVDITPCDFHVEHDFCLIWQRGSQYAPRWRALCDGWRAALAPTRRQGGATDESAHRAVR